MENILRTTSSNRYVIDEDFIPKVTSDGQPHEMMTLIAGLCGLLAAIVVLFILITLLGWKDPETSQSQRNRHRENVINNNFDGSKKGTRLLNTFFARGKTNEALSGDNMPQLTSISIIENNGKLGLKKFNDCSVKTFKLPDITTGKF